MQFLADDLQIAQLRNLLTSEIMLPENVRRKLTVGGTDFNWCVKPDKLAEQCLSQVPTELINKLPLHGDILKHILKH